MTLRARTTRPTSRRTRLRRMFDDEQRQQAAVTIAFIVAIAAVVLILVASIGLAWYNDNVRPLARVGSVEIGPQFLRDKLELELWRIQRERNRLTQANIAGEIDAARLSELNSVLDQRAQALEASALDDLVDQIYQTQLAPSEGVSVAEADIDAAVAEEFNSVEKRRVQAIFVRPGDPSTPDEELNNSDRLAALARAREALAAIDGGRPWAEVAREFSTDASAASGGEYGIVSEVGVVDREWGDRLFELPLNGMTGIVRGEDGTYRIGRVTEILDAPEEPGLREDLRRTVGDEGLRELLRYEVTSGKLRDKITAAALAATPEQVRIALVYIDGLPSGTPGEEEGEVEYSEIVFAPNDQLEEAPDLPADNPAWEAARVEAQTVYDELVAITDPAAREARLREIASSNSDSPTGEDGGAVEFVTRDIPPDAVGAALFDTPHEPGTLIAPVRGDAGWYVLLFHERRDSPAQRIQRVKDELAKPNADFAAIAREFSDGPEAEDGGEIGWVTRDQLAEDLAEDVFALSAGQVSEPIELGEGTYFIKALEKQSRPLDPDQIPDVRAQAFANWYGPKRDEAETNDTIVFAGAEEQPPPEGEFPEEAP